MKDSIGPNGSAQPILNGNGHVHSATCNHNKSHSNSNRIDDIGDMHVATSWDTPLRPDAFDLSDQEKIEQITAHFREIMNIMGLDLTDDSLSGTPRRVAKMYINEIYSGLNPANKPAIRLFENPYDYHEMLIEKDITFYSTCEHHFVPIYGKAHVAYIPNGKVVGLSKINRLVQHFARRPQVQERLNVQIARELSRALDTPDVAVIIDADHMCVASRGVKDTNSRTITSQFLGAFQDEANKSQFLNFIR